MNFKLSLIKYKLIPFWKVLKIGKTATPIIILGQYILYNKYIKVTWYCTHFLKIGFVVAGGVFYSYYSTKGINQIKKGKKLIFMHTKNI